jgi:pYEATS domain-containing protein involved in immunity
LLGIIVIGTIFLIALSFTTTSYVASAVADNSSLNRDPPVTNTMDEAHKFSLRYNSTLVQTKPQARWNMTVWVETDPKVLLQIEKVSYLPYPFFTNNNQVINVSSFENNFALSMNVFAGPRINATVYFKDHKVIRYPPLQTFVTGPHEVFPIEFILDPSISGLNATINGKAIAKQGNITEISVDWGDGNSSKGNFPFLHNYSRSIPDLINITAFSNLGLFQSQSISTSPLIVQRSIPKDSSVDISTKAKAVLNVSTSLSSMPDNVPMKYNISGTLSSTLNNSGIVSQPILIDMFWVEHPDIYNRPEHVKTGENGYYSFQDNNLALQAGNYKITVRPEKPIYAGLSGSKDLVVHPHPWTSDQLITYLGIGIGAAVTVIGVILKVPSYFTAIKQSNNLSTYISKVNNKYNEFNEEKSIDKNQFVQDLENIRSNITYLLEKRDLSENQYKMIDDKIAYYLDKVSKPPESY